LARHVEEFDLKQEEIFEDMRDCTILKLLLRKSWTHFMILV